MSASTFEERFNIVEPAITAHLEGLVMDTPEDNAIIESLRLQWRWLKEGETREVMLALVKHYNDGNDVFGGTT